MSLEKTLAISGKPGLYKLITQAKGGFVAESLIDNKRSTFTMRHKISVLSEIAIYTLKEEVPLQDVFLKISEKENGGPTSINYKDSKDVLEEYFFEVLPDYDEDRVYASDIKKIIQWYNLLHKQGLLDFSESKAAAKEEVSSEEEE